MLLSKSFFIDSCDDEELGIKRKSKLEYRISYDDEKEMKALVFLIPGTGANMNISFIDFDREYLAKKFDVAVVSVFYHCFCVRFNEQEKRYSASMGYEKKDLDILKRTLAHFKLDIRTFDPSMAKSYINQLDKHMQELKDNAKLDENAKVLLNSVFCPPNDEYQNYAVMPAIDHINALKDICKNFPKFKNLPKIWGGGSYGGYLALFIAKIAPWHVDAAIDNSGSCLPILRYIIGRDLNECEFFMVFKNVDIGFFVKTHWTRKDNTSAYFFSNEHYMIRSLLNSSHLALQAQKNKDQILISYHSLKDEFGTAKDKQILYAVYKELGLNANLHLIKDESQIDKKYIKHLDHGLGMSYRALFRKELPVLLQRLKGKKFSLKEDTISYACGGLTFNFKDKKDKFELSLS